MGATGAHPACRPPRTFRAPAEITDQDAFAELDSERPKRRAELARIEAELRKLENSLERYFRAFEDGTLESRVCGARLDELAQKPEALEARRAELSYGPRTSRSR